MVAARLKTMGMKEDWPDIYGNEFIHLLQTWPTYNIQNKQQKH